MLVLPRADHAHVDDRRVNVARVEEVLGVVFEYLTAGLAGVGERVVAGESVLEVSDPVGQVA